MDRRGGLEALGHGSGLFTETGYPRVCALCPPSITFPDRIAMAHHLRRVHATKEGGSFICRYGANGVCPTLPLEGVSDRDYEVHLRKCHMAVATPPPSNQTTTAFTVHSFTQNLSSVLSDPSRPRAEVHSFLTRHWGEGFVAKARVGNSQLLPSIDKEHFTNYLQTTVQRHERYLRAKSELSRSVSRRHNTRIDTNDLPKVFLSPHFSLADTVTFEAIFLEPGHRVDQLVSTDSTVALSSAQAATDTDIPRQFRAFPWLRNQLEHYQDVVDARLNNQLTAKSNSFWSTVKACGSLHGELADASSKVALVRSHLQQVNDQVYLRMRKVMDLYKRRQQRECLLHKLQDMCCLRDAQLTVQVLLNQSDYPKALECIQTAQDVLTCDLHGIVCFRHLSSQLQELHKVISKMLQEEFVVLIQKELGRSCENEVEAVCEDGQLNAVVLGLLRVAEYRFVHVLQHEILEAIKNSLRSVIKSHVVASGEQLTAFDPSLGSLGNQMRKLPLTAWLQAAEHLFRVLLCACRRVQSIQELLLDNIDTYHMHSTAHSGQHLCVDSNNDARVIMSRHASTLSLSAPLIESSSTTLPQSQSASCVSDCLSPPPVSLSAVLSTACRSISEVRHSVGLLTAHAAYAAQERSCRLLLVRCKDSFIETLNLMQLQRLLDMVEQFNKRCALLVGAALSYSSPLSMCVMQLSARFINHFHQQRKTLLSKQLDSENWRVAQVHSQMQAELDECMCTARVACNSTSLPYVQVQDEHFVVVGTALLLVHVMCEYCDALTVLPSHASELLVCLVDILNAFNSRSCQLILGAGALQLVGLKSISVKHLALSSRSLQLIVRLMPLLRTALAQHLSTSKHNQLRHVDHITRDYQEHIDEITNKLVSVIEHHTQAQLQQWQVDGTVPSLSFQLICKQLTKFHNGLTGIMPEQHITSLFVRVHTWFKTNLKQQLHLMDITPHNSLIYGLVSQDYAFYITSMRALPACRHFSEHSISEALYSQ